MHSKANALSTIELHNNNNGPRDKFDIIYILQNKKGKKWLKFNVTYAYHNSEEREIIFK